MKKYTVILFYNNGTHDTQHADSLAEAIAIQAGALSAWYMLAMNCPVKSYHLTGFVVINNMQHTVVQNNTYKMKGDRQCQNLS